MPQFTKGKWKIIIDPIGFMGTIDICTKDKGDICSLINYSARKCNNEMIANARLIAESPVMYDLLNKAFHILGKNAANDGICREIDECLSRIDGAPVRTEKGG